MNFYKTGLLESTLMQIDREKIYDVIIIGSGAGGGTLAYALSQQNINVLVIEKGDFLPKEAENRSEEGVSGIKYRTPTKLEFNGHVYDSYSHSYVGGQTKLYGAALYRFRKEDFNEIKHLDGISPKWPISYDDLEPYYTEAEKIYKVHGSIDEDITEPFHSEPYPYKPLAHEDYIKPLINRFQKQGLNVSYIPKAIDYSETGHCEFCQNCDGYACELGGKMDTEEACLNPAFNSGYVDLLKNTECLKIIKSPNEDNVSSILVKTGDEEYSLKSKIYVLACGVMDSPALLLKSACDEYPHGLANSSGLVGRYFCGHNSGVFLLPTFKKIPEIHQKTFAINDFYSGKGDYKYPLGLLQAGGRLPVWLEVEKWLRPIAKFIAKRSIIVFIMSEVVPRYENYVSITKDGHVSINYTPNNIKTFRKLRMLFLRIFWKAGYLAAYCSRHPVGGMVWHPVGTLRFGHNPKKSVLDTYCKTHDIDNLYVVDSSFLPSAGTVNTSLTVMAQALRVADNIAKRLKA